MQHKNLSPEEIDASTKKYIATIYAIGRVVSKTIPWAGLVWISFYLKECVESLSGKHTIADVALTMFGSIKMNQWAAWILAGICGIGWGRERRIRRNKVKTLTRQKSELELRIDKNRTSSNLTDGGLEPEEER